MINWVSYSRPFILIFTALFAFICSCSLLPGSTVPSREKIKDQGETSAQSNAQMTQEELQAAVIAYANRFIATIGQASVEFEKELPTPEARLLSSSRRVYSLMAVAEIAAGPNPGAALLDMVVITSLNRVVWDEYWRPQIFGIPATVIVDAYKKLEKDIWTQASRVMTLPQRQELREILQEWWINNPKQYAVDYIRFSDFGNIGKKPNLKQIQKPGGLMAPIREATKAVDEVKIASERAMFLLTKMQIIANFQVEMAYRNIIFQPETRNLMKNIDQFSRTAREMEDFLATLPEHTARERRAIFQDVSLILQQERKALVKSLHSKETQELFEQVNGTLDRLDKNFTQLNQGLAAADQVVRGGEKTGVVFIELVQALENFTSNFESEKPFDINEYTQAMAQLEKSSDKLRNLVTSVNKTIDDLAASIMTDVNQSAEKRVDHIFIRLVQLCLIAGAVVIALIIINRFFGQPKTK